MCKTYSLRFCLLPVLIGLIQYVVSNPPPAPICDPECAPTAICLESEAGADSHNFCACPPGKTGVNCTLDDPCPQIDDCPSGKLCFGPCEPNVYCQGETGEAHCMGCLPGWNGPECDLDINECRHLPTPCYNGGTCVNEQGDYRCICTPEWIGKECRCEAGKPCMDDYIPSETIEEVTTTNVDAATYRNTAPAVQNEEQTYDHLLTLKTSHTTDSRNTTPSNGQSRLTSTMELCTMFTLSVIAALRSRSVFSLLDT